MKATQTKGGCDCSRSEITRNMVECDFLGFTEATIELCDRRREGRRGKVGRKFTEAGEKVVWEREGGSDPAEAMAVDAEAVPMYWLDSMKKHYRVGTRVITTKKKDRGRGQ